MHVATLVLDHWPVLLPEIFGNVPKFTICPRRPWKFAQVLQFGGEFSSRGRAAEKTAPPRRKGVGRTFVWLIKSAATTFPTGERGARLLGLPTRFENPRAWKLVNDFVPQKPGCTYYTLLVYLSRYYPVNVARAALRLFHVEHVRTRFRCLPEVCQIAAEGALP